MRDYKNLILREGPAGYWPMDESSGTNVADVSAGNDATMSGAAQVAAAGLVNRAGYSSNFDAPTAAYLSAAHSLPSIVTEFSAEAWVQFDNVSLSLFTAFLSVPDAAGVNGFDISLSSTNVISMSAGDTGGAALLLLNSTITPVVGQVYHVVGTIKDGNAVLYVDGVSVATGVKPTNNNVSLAHNEVNIGCFSSTSSGRFDGRVQDCTIYDYELTAEQVAEHYLAGVQPGLDGYDLEVRKDFPLGYWKLNDRDGQVAKDEMGVTNGAYVGTVTQRQDSLLVSDVVSKSVLLDGVTGLVRADHSLGGSLSNASMEITFLLASPITLYTVLFSAPFDNIDKNGLDIAVDASGNIRADFSDGGSVDGVDYLFLVSTKPTKVGEIVHCVATFDNGACKIYANGVLIASGSKTDTTISIAGNELAFGRVLDSIGNYFDGSLQNGALYDITLSPERVVSHYVASIKKADAYSIRVLADTPTGYWRLGEASGVAAVDETGTNGGTYVASPALGQGGLIINDTDKSITLNGSTQYVDLTTADQVYCDFAVGFSFELVMDFTDLTFTNEALPIVAAFKSSLTGPVAVLMSNANPTYLDMTIGAIGNTVKMNMSLSGVIHLVATYDPTDGWVVYRNGVPVTTAAGTTLSGTNSSIIGGVLAPGFLEPYTGGIDEVSVYNYKLSPRQALDHYLSARIFTDNNYRKAVLESLPVGYWPLDESSGTNAIDLIGSNDGTIAGTPTLDEVSLLVGDGGVAITFDGIDDSVSMGQVHQFTKDNAFSLEYSINNSGAGPDMVISSQEVGGQVGGYAVFINTGKVVFILRNTVTTNELRVETVDLVNDSTDHHVVIAYDGSSLASGVTIYIDGTAVTFTTITDTLTSALPGSREFYIGRNTAGSYFNGKIDEVSVYGHELTPQNVANNYIAGIALL